MDILYSLLALLLIARFCGEAAERLQQPALVGELIAGIFIGMFSRLFSDRFPQFASLPDNEVFVAITDLGIFFLMLLGGIELQPRQLAKSTKKSFPIGLGGVLLPFLMGGGLGWWLFPASELKVAQSLFLGTALAITAVPVTIKVLMDLNRLNSEAGQIIISAAVVDDILGLALLAILTGVIESGSVPGVTSFLLLLGKVVCFFAATILIGQYVFSRLWRWVESIHLDEFEFSLVLIFGLIYAALAESFGLHFILGAFMAGLFFTRHTPDQTTYTRVKEQFSGITTGFLAPVFFASIGMHMDFNAVFASPFFLLLVILVAFAGKLIGSGVLGYYTLGLSLRQATAVGFGMSGRGAVELIIADIALRAGLFSAPLPVPPIIANLFSSIVLMAVITTLVAPMILKRTLK